MKIPEVPVNELVPLAAHADTEGDLAQQVLDGSHRLAQVLANWISNAAWFSPPRTSTEIAARLCADGFRFGVRDHSPGIVVAIVDRLPAAR